MKNGNGREPEVLAVDMKSWDGVEIHLENDGIMTSRTVDETGGVDLMQTRSAFRGFVMGMVTLMNYTIVEAYGVGVGEDE